ncbi:peptidase domain-containing ABC transporter [Paenibacillus silvae]|uniref:Peptidase domain-containing ABC transporter n=1 Tax=Paenibacillus silvae TaxID=1325358 RepID=A0A2W6NJ18_9BACL|nr:peptidase domain-containing ABC transporter [Paenibacillus silvae]PZT55699.1 peptidase domain-containing ABC transporter [Paenibacillus silvae]
MIRKRNIPFIEQMSQTECGIACMAMLCAYYGKHVTLFELRDRIGSGRDGNTLYDLKRLGEDLGLESKCYKIEDLNLLSQLKEPLICFWEQKHYVVLERISSKYYYILDPAQGRMKLNKEQFMHSFSNYVLHGKPGTAFQQQKPKSLWKPYLEMLWKKPKLLTFMLFTNLLLQLFVLISPIFVQQMIDNIAIQDNSKYINIYLLGMIVSFALYFVFALIKNEVSIHVFKYLDRSMSWQYFRHLLVIPYNFFQIRSTGDLMYRFSNLRSIRLILSNQVMKSILDAILFIVIVSYMLVKSPLLSIYVFLFAGLLYLGIQLLRPHLHEASRNELSKDTKLFSYQNESVSGILNIKITGAEETVSQRWKSYYDHFVKAFVTRERLYGILGAFSGGLTMYMPLFIIWIGAGHVAAGGLSLGELIAFQTIAVYFISTANSLILSLETFYQLKVYLRRIRDVVDTPAEVPQGTKLLQAELTGEIAFDQVSFAYTMYSEPVLKDLNFQIQAGQKIAIIGASGSGKSTLANLLVGLYRPSEGEIYYGPHRLEELDKPYIRQQMGIVNQQPFMFNQSIVDNIKGNNEQVTMEDIVQAAKVAQIHEEIMNMPMKYETLLSENAQNMSGGQRQRLAIARALVHLPKIIVFDEATNALDSINEKKIDEFLSQLQCTRIVIAHRLSTIMDADQIFVMSNGSIVEKGRHDELIQTSTYYQNLVEAYRFMDMKGGEKHVISSVEKPVFQNS